MNSDRRSTGPRLYEGKKVLVAGGTGTIGVPLVKQLLGRNADVTVVSLEDPVHARRLLGPDVRYQREDLTQTDACLRAAGGQDIVFNMVGIKGSVGIGETRVASYFVPMLRYQTNLMDAAFRCGVSRYLFVSSICAYPQATLHEEDNMWNGMPKQNDRYPGLAKRIGEIQGETYLKEFGWDAVRVVRPSNVYGPFDDFDPRTAQVIPALIRRMLDGEDPIVVWGDGSAVRDFIFSDDVAYWCLEALDKAPPCTPVNLGSGTGCTIRALVETIARNLPTPPPRVEWDPSKPAGDPVRCMSMERARRLIGFTPRTSLDDGIRQTIAWYREHRHLASPKEEIAQ